MAKKRRGRPLGSRNKKSRGKSVVTMDVGQLRAYIEDLQGVLSKKISEQRAHLENQLAELGNYVSTKAARAARAVMPRTGRRAKPAPKYQSKKNKSLRWTGRGVLPTWMREEMKGTKLTKESFLIK